MARFKIKGKGQSNEMLYSVPDLQHFAKTSRGESLIIFDPPHDKPSLRTCFGIGRVYHVEKGKDMDLVCINFGRHYARKIIVRDNHARRQIYTLKKGQLCSYYGYMQVFVEDNQTKAVFFGMGFNAWFVPKKLDIKHYDSDTVEELTKENETNMLNFLDLVIEDFGNDEK